MSEECEEEERLDKNQALDIAALVGSILATIVYGWLLYNFSILILQATAFIPVAVVLLVLGWIGYKMATTRT